MSIMNRKIKNDLLSQFRRLIVESFILFSVIAMGLLVYLRIHPYAYPGLALKIYWVLLVYIISLISLFYMEITSSFVNMIEIVIVKTNKVGLPLSEKFRPLVKRIRVHIDEYNSKHTKFELMTHGVNITFQILLVVFLLTILIQELEPTMANWINMNYFLILVIIFGVVTVLTNKENNTQRIEQSTITKSDYLFIAIAGVVGTIIIWYKIQNIGNISYLVAFLSGILIVLLSILVITEDENEQISNFTNNSNTDR